MGKLEQYANKLKAKKAKARDFIEKYERLGFTFSDALKASANEPTPDRMQKKTLDRLSRNANLDLRRLMGHITKQRPRQKVNVTLHNPQNQNGVKNGQFSLNVTPKTVTDLITDLNSNLQSLKSYKSIQEIWLAVYHNMMDTNKGIPSNKKDYETNDYILTKGWSASDINKHIIFKKTADFNQTYIKDILSVPQTTNKGKEIYKEDWHHRSFKTGVDNILDRQGGSLLSSLTRTHIDALESIMHSSEAWNVVKKGFSYKDGKNKGVVQDRWIKLYKATADLDNTDDEDAFDKLKTMIDNEEDFDKILTYVNDTIKKIQEAKKDEKQEDD